MYAKANKWVLSIRLNIRYYGDESQVCQTFIQCPRACDWEISFVEDIIVYKTVHWAKISLAQNGSIRYQEFNYVFMIFISDGGMHHDSFYLIEQASSEVHVKSEWHGPRPATRHAAAYMTHFNGSMVTSGNLASTILQQSIQDRANANSPFYKVKCHCNIYVW